MKLLWFSHFIPFPPVGGAHQRSFNLLRHASRFHEVSLVAFNLRGQAGSHLSEAQAELMKYCASVEFWNMPVGWKSPAWWARLAVSPLDRVPYSCRSFWSPGLGTRWNQVLQRRQGTLVHFDSIDLALFAGATAGFRKVLNHHNCESALTERRAKNEWDPVKKLYLRSQARKLARLERAVCPLFDVNTVVSEFDAQLLRSRSPEAHFHIVENGTDIDYFVPANGSEEANSLIFAGRLSWYPNISALRFLLREIWPLVKARRPGIRLYVAGQNPSPSLVQLLRQDPSIHLEANPKDIRPWVARAALFVCPILDGGGTKLKILDAMAMGKPVVSTTIGCEGLHVKHDENVLMADRPLDFAHTVLRALENKALRQQLAAAGRALVEKEYSWDVIGGHLEQAYRCAQDPCACEHRVFASATPPT